MSGGIDVSGLLLVIAMTSLWVWLWQRTQRNAQPTSRTRLFVQLGIWVVLWLFAWTVIMVTRALVRGWIVS